MNKEDFGLYRDDGLGIFKKNLRTLSRSKTQNIIKIFKEYGLSITCEVNKVIADFLDVRFNLNDQTSRPRCFTANG